MRLTKRISETVLIMIASVNLVTLINKTGKQLCGTVVTLHRRTMRLTKRISGVVLFKKASANHLRIYKRTG